MVKGFLARALVAATLVMSVPAVSLAGDDDLTPRSINALALQFEVQQEQIDRLNERIDNIRVGVVRDRIKALETAVAALSGPFATSQFTVVSGLEPDTVEAPAQEATE